MSQTIELEARHRSIALFDLHHCGPRHVDVFGLTGSQQLEISQTVSQSLAGRTAPLRLLPFSIAEAATIRPGMSIAEMLQTSYIVFLLPPLLANVRKRLVRSPKLYFYDVGLAAYLLGIRQADQVWTHPLRGALFENLVVAEALKHRFHSGRGANLAFYRDRGGNEVDLIYELGEHFVAIEIKSGSTVASDALRGLHRLQRLFPDRVARSILVHGGDSEQVRSGAQVTSARRLVDHLAAVDDSAP